MTEELKERVAEKSWTTIEVSSTALELQDRLSGSVVHVDDVTEYLCDQCKHGKEGALLNNGHRDCCILCAGAESLEGCGNKSEHFRMAAADLLQHFRARSATFMNSCTF